MRKPIALIALAVLFVLALFALRVDRPSAAQQPQRLVQQWEYETIRLSSPDVGAGGKLELNRKGKQGWDLCGSAQSIDDKITFLILKRPTQ